MGKHAKIWLSFGVLLALAGCGEPRPNHEATDFESAGYAGSSRGPGGADGGAAAPDDRGPEGMDRTVEEADLYRIVGDRLYVLNQYRGLYVFDVTDPDHPRELGRMPLVGYPVEMYVRGDRAYAILSDYFTYWYDERAFADAGLTPYFGSRIVAIDLSDPEAPREIGDVLLDGYVADTRLVGDVIYAVANRYAWWGHYGVRETETRDLTVLTSIDIADPTRITEVQQLTLDGNGWFVHATSDAFVVAGNVYVEGTWEAQTELRYVDISDPRGAIAARGAIRVSGAIQDDTALDVHEDQLRLLTRNSDGVTTHVRIFDATQPDTLPLLGQLDYEYRGSVFGTTFDGDRLYMIHYQTIDPLEVVDLSDPTAPFIAGILEMPGWVERIAANGDRLVGLGVDDTDGQRRTSLTLFDVADPANPRLLARENVDAQWSWSAATWERKAWTVDWTEGLVLFPYSGYGSTGRWDDYHNALSIVELGRDSLARRGTVEAPAPVERGFLHEGRVYALSQAALQVVDVRDRTRPTPTATVELVRSITDYVRTDRAGLELIQPGISWGWYGTDSQDTILRTTPLDAPDTRAELGRVVLPRGADRIAQAGSLTLAIRSSTGWWSRDSESIPSAGVTVVDTADPARLRIVADLDLPEEPTPAYGGILDGYVSRYTDWRTSYGAPFGSYGGGAALLDVGGGRYGLIRTTNTWCSGLEACRSVGIEPVSYDWGSGERYYHGSRFDNDLVIVELDDPARPEVHGPYPMGEGRVEQPFVRDGRIVLSHALPSRVDADGRTWVRWFYERWSLGSDGVPRLESAINVPGIVLEARADGVITLDQQWTAMGELRNVLTGVSIGDGRATRRSVLELGSGWLPALAVRGTQGYALRMEYDREWRSSATVDRIELGDVSALRVSQTLRLGESAWGVAALTDRTLALHGGWDGGLGLFDIAHDGSLSFRRYVRSHGWSTRVTEQGGVLYLARGPYGMAIVPLEE
jgi:hypothetical protein